MSNTQIINLDAIAATSGSDYTPVIDAINAIIELKYVLVHPDMLSENVTNGYISDDDTTVVQRQRLRFASPDIAVQYCAAPSYVQTQDNCIQSNQEELANLLAYLQRCMDSELTPITPADELYNYRLSALNGSDKWVLNTDCIPRHTSIAEVDQMRNRGILSELANTLVCVPFNRCNVTFLERENDKVDIVWLPRWRAVEVACTPDSFDAGLSWNGMWHETLSSDNRQNKAQIERWKDYDMQSFFVPIPDGVSQRELLDNNMSIDYLRTSFHSTNNGYTCELDLVRHPSNDEIWIHQRDLITHDGHSFISIRNLAETLNVERTPIRTYHSHHDVQIKRNQHYPQSLSAKLLSKFTIGFEVEKTNVSYIRSSEQTIKLPLFAGWEYDGSCGIEGITHAYSMDNLAGFTKDAEDSTFMTDLELNGSCGGHINIMDNNVQRNSPHRYPTERYLGRKQLRPLVGVIYALWRDRLKNSYCSQDVRIVEESPDRYTAIRNKRNRMTELRISAAFKKHDDLVRAFSFMQTIVKCAVVSKVTAIARVNGISDVRDCLVSELEYNYTIDQINTPRLQRAANPDFLTDYYHKYRIPAYHANYNGTGNVGRPDTRSLHYDWIYYVIDSLTPWFKANGYNHARMVDFTRDAYALQHYVDHSSTNKTCEHARKYTR